MLKRFLALFATLAIALLPLPAYAQSSAQPVLPGLLSTSGCPSVNLTPCYLPYSNSNPLPVSATITPSGTQDTNLKQVNGATVNVGAGAAGTGTQRVTTSTDSTIGTVTSVTSATVVQPTGSNLHVQVDTAPSTAVTNAGTFATQSAINQTTPGTTNNVTVSTNVGTLPLVQTTASAAVSTSSAATLQVIAASGSAVIRVTQWVLVTTLANNVTWESADTGGSCANPVALTGAMPFAANGGVSAGTGLGPILILPSGKALCMLTSAATQISGSVGYAQF